MYTILKEKVKIYDPHHGKRAIEYIKRLNIGGVFHLNDKQLEQLMFACEHHSNHRIKSEDITIQTCWDADRLDLYRVGEIPYDKFLNTEVAKTDEAKEFSLRGWLN